MKQSQELLNLRSNNSSSYDEEADVQTLVHSSQHERCKFHWFLYTAWVLQTYTAELISIRRPWRSLAILRLYGSKMGYLVGTRLLPGSLVHAETLSAPRTSYSKSLCCFSCHVSGPRLGVYCLTEPLWKNYLQRGFRKNAASGLPASLFPSWFDCSRP